MRALTRPTAFPPAEQERFLTAIRKEFGTDVLQKKEICDFADRNGFPAPGFLFSNKARNVSHGHYFVGNTTTVTTSTSKNTGFIVDDLFSIQPTETPIPSTPMEDQEILTSIPTIKEEVIVPADDSALQFIPETDPTYIPFGFFNDMKTIVKSKMFYPVYVTGLSGNGKTLSILQCHALLKKPVIRVNITKDTDEFDLYGSFELLNGNTVMRVGPVFMAMEMGATLLLDEVDYGSEKLLCLQPALENRPIFDKKRKKMVHPKPGYNVMCTANTKGKGDMSGKFIGANVLNEAFLERFPLTVEQAYPSKDVETRIVYANFKTLGVERTSDVERITGDLIKWATRIRETYENDGIAEVISTRRIVNIVKTYTIFNDLDKAINLCISRFDTETKTTMKDFFDKCKSSAAVPKSTSKMASHTTSVAPPSAPRATASKFTRVGMSVTKQFKNNVVITTKDGNIEVYSHTMVTTFPENSIKPIETDPAQFEKEIAAAVEENEAAYRKMIGASP